MTKQLQASFSMKLDQVLDENEEPMVLMARNPRPMDNSKQRRRDFYSERN